MFPAHPLHRIGAASAAAVLASFALVGPAAADQPADRGKHGAAHGHAKGHGKQADKPKADDKGKPGTRGHGHGHGHDKGKSGTRGHGHGEDVDNVKGAGKDGDPGGNNGTVKIVGPTDEAGHPSNNPHPGCEVLVEWYGFDAGPDVLSTVTFTPHAPTADTVLAGVAPASVFVGEDAAGGGTDLDARQAYTLTFDGTPHPQQGYHVKLTVAAPHSNGNDTKSKVFWFEPCETTAPAAPTETETEEPADETDEETEAPVTETEPAEEETDTDTPIDVLGIFATSGDKSEDDLEVAGVQAQAGDDVQAAVPTAVDAGEGGDETTAAAWAKGPLPAALLGLAALAGGAWYWRRTRTGT